MKILWVYFFPISPSKYPREDQVSIAKISKGKMGYGGENGIFSKKKKKKNLLLLASSVVFKVNVLFKVISG